MEKGDLSFLAEIVGNITSQIIIHRNQAQMTPQDEGDISEQSHVNCTHVTISHEMHNCMHSLVMKLLAVMYFTRSINYIIQISGRAA